MNTKPAATNTIEPWPDRKTALDAEEYLLSQDIAKFKARMQAGPGRAPGRLQKAASFLADWLAVYFRF